jgi:hypothetical protein
MPTFNMDNQSQETDVKGDAVNMGVIDTGATPAKQVNATYPAAAATYAYHTDSGLHDFFTTTGNTTKIAPEKYWDETLNSDNGGTAVT